MPGIEFEFQVEGAEELTKKLNNQNLLAKPLRDFLTKAALTVENRTKQLTPVDTGKLRASITHEVDAMLIPSWAKVGSQTNYAPFVEYDTRPHFPPPAALESWAHRHGFSNVFIVCRKIARRGTKGKKMLTTALEESKEKINSMMAELGESIKGKWTE